MFSLLSDLLPLSLSIYIYFIYASLYDIFYTLQWRDTYKAELDVIGDDSLTLRYSQADITSFEKFSEDSPVVQVSVDVVFIAPLLSWTPISKLCPLTNKVYPNKWFISIWFKSTIKKFLSTN